MEEKDLVQNALNGDKKSLEVLINSVQGLLFNLALRFLWNRPDAEDATQEILIRIITNLSKFDMKSKFSTWAYRIGVNFLINQKKSTLEKELSFSAFAKDLETIKGPTEYNGPDKDLLEKELKTGCTLAMLQCLDRDLRLAFILGSSLKLTSKQAAEITGTSPENFRKRLELSRKRIGNFMNSNCGVYNPKNNCRCQKRIGGAIKCGQVNPNRLNFADKMEMYNEEMEELESLKGIYNNHGTFKNSEDFVHSLNTLIQSKAIIRGL